MIQNKIVVRYQDGKILKGQTNDFMPARPTFHISLIDTLPGTAPTEVQIADVKAVFFVKDHAGNREHKNVQQFPEGKSSGGRKIKVEFKDGEVLMGTTQGYDPKRPGFFIVPADTNSNNDRCFVIASATQNVSFV